MLETIIVILLILWLLGAFVTPIPAIGSLIHVLLVVILVVVVIRLLAGAPSPFVVTMPEPKSPEESSQAAGFAQSAFAC
jgi:hypothetical protein